MRINPFHSIQGKFTLYLTALIVATVSAIAYWNISREKALMERAIIREGELIIPRGDTMLMPDDDVLALVHSSQLVHLASVLRGSE